MTHLNLFSILSVLVALLVSLTGRPTITPQTVLVSEPTPTTTVSVTPTDVPTETPSPTETPTETPTPTPQKPTFIGCKQHSYSYVKGEGYYLTYKCKGLEGDLRQLEVGQTTNDPTN